jgi:hypothetical protein
MKIKIVKKATKAKPAGICGHWVDEPPMNKK